MNLNNKKIGIWGYGIMGKTAVDFFSKTNNVSVFDSKILSPEQRLILGSQQIKVYHPTDFESFIFANEIIIPSSGIDLRSYQEIHQKIIPELDLFAHYFHKPIIAITGTLGKTTITKQLSKVLTNAGLKILVGGNIGIGLFDLINKQKDIDYAVIEVSSFQLEHCKLFAPDLAIWTNFYPNHLDRHSTIDDYFEAKTKILSNQKAKQKTLIPLSLKNQLNKFHCNFYYFSQEKPTTLVDNLFYSDRLKFYHHQKGINRKILTFNTEPLFLENWLIIASVLKILNIPLEFFFSLFQSESLEHRLEKVALVNSVTFYNDSKATVPEATLAAIKTLNMQPLILFLGGISKGIDREPMIKNISGTVKKVFCFGKEAIQLNDLCKKYDIISDHFDTLDTAFNAYKKETKPSETVLFSPSGASFDLFSNYIERGNYFKKLVESFSNE